MVIREAGIIIGSIPLVYSQYHDIDGNNSQVTLRSALISSILDFAECTFDSVEYFEGSKYIIAFRKDTIESEHPGYMMDLIAYAIFDKKEKLDKYMKKKISPALDKMIASFSEQYARQDFSNINLYSEFKNEIDILFGEDTQSSDEKFKILF